MINNIYELEDGRQYIVIAEENFNRSKYVLIIECNLEKDEIKEDEILLKKIIFRNNEIVFGNVSDEELNNVLPIMISNYRNK